LINPGLVEAHKKEAEQRIVDLNQAWDDVKFIDLEVEEDWLDKAQAIVAGEDYDDRVQMPLTLDNDQLFDLMKLAHERDVTLNQMVETVLREHIEQHEKNS
jgi:predicted nucleic acid-binding protein